MSSLPEAHTTSARLLKQIAPVVDRLPPIEFAERRWGEIDSYGANWMLARRLGLPKPLEVYDTINWAHGVYDVPQISASPAFLSSVLNYKFPNEGRDRRLLVENTRAETLLRAAGYRHAVAVGLPFIYEEQEVELPRVPRSVLAVGTHSTPWFSLFDGKVNAVDGKAKDLAFPQAAARLKEKFDVVAACIGASDVLRGHWIPAFEHNEIPWLTGAWITDANALRRMQRIFRSFEYVATNCQGSHIFYALYCGCKVFWYGDDSDVNLNHVFKLDQRPGRGSDPEIAAQVKQGDASFRKLYPFLFCAPEGAVANVAVGAELIGEPHRRAPEEIADLLGWKLKPAGAKKWQPVNPLDVCTPAELAGQFREALKHSDSSVVRALLEALQSRGKDLRNAYLALGQKLAAEKRLPEARAALAEEIRRFPDNADAKKFLEAIDAQLETVARKEDGKLSARVLFVAHGPAQVNGPNIWLTRLLPELKARGFAPRVLMFMTRQGACPIAEKLRAAGIACDTLNWSHTEDMVRAIVGYVEKNPCDVFVPNLNVQGYFASKTLLAAGIPTVGVLHSDDVFHRDLIDEFIRGQGGRYLGAAVTVSTFQEEALRALEHGATRIVRAPYGAPVPAAMARFSKQPFRFVYVGRLVEEQKRISDTVNAMIALLRRQPTAEFQICGDGAARPAIEKLIAQANLGTRIKLRGNLPSHEVQAVLLESQALVLLSDYEGIPIALMEAMGCGVVPICTRIRSGVGDILRDGENGLLVADRGDSFIAAAERLMGDEAQWARCSTAARATVETNFSIRANAEMWATLLAELHADAPRTKSPLTLPRQLDLPPVRPNPKGIAREDRRKEPSTSVSTSAPHPFTNPPLEPNNADLYWTRASILKAVEQAVPLLHGTFLDIGCGIMPYREIITRAPSRVTRYIGMDIETPIYKAAVDLRWDGRRIPLEDASVDSAMATEVLEHCPDPLVVLKEARRVLKPGGVFFFTVPYIWPLHDAPYDFFRYTPFALEKLLTEAGFGDVKVQAMGGWNASLAQMIGLWLKRSPMPADLRNKMARQLWPLYQELVNSDQLPADPKAGNTMATGWTGLAYAPADVATAQPTAPIAVRSTEVEPSELPVVLVRSHEYNYSETFVEDHVNYVSKNLTLLYGYPFPRFVKGGRSVLNDAVEQKIKSAIANGGTASPELWHEYAAGLAAFLKTCGARVALVETGLMGAFVHEACEQAALPYVVHFHGLDAFGRELLERWQERYQKFFRTAAQLLVVSKAMREQLIKLGAPAERVILAPYGVSVAMTQHAEPGKAAPHFVAVGRFVEKKGPHLTLQAFAAVRRLVPEAKLVMMGDGPLLKPCQEWVAKNGLADAVTFAGVQSRDEVSRHMAASRVFVQHSMTAANGDSEGLPLAVLEAGAHGLTVVSTLHAGIPDAVRDRVDGFLVAEKDVKSMAAAMLRLARDPGLAGAFGASFRTRVETRYSRKRSIERLQALLGAAAEGKPGAALGEPLDECPETTRAETTNDASAAAAQLEDQRVPIAAPTVDAALAAISADRNDCAAYVDLGTALLEQGANAEAYCAIGEAHRLTGGSAVTADALKSLEEQGVLTHDTVQTYRQRAGWLPPAKSPQPRRILVVTNLLPPQEMGGYGRTMWEFSRELSARGHDVRVLTADMPHLVRKPAAEHQAFESHVQRVLRLCGDWKNGSAVVEPDANRRREILAGNHQKILLTVKEFRPDVVIAGNIDFLGHHFIQPILDAGLPVVHRLGNALPGYDVNNTPQSALYCLAGCSEWVHENLRAKGYTLPRTAVLPPGSPLGEYYRAFAPSRDKLRIAFASLLMPYKGAHVLVDALARLHRAKIDFECTLAGDSTNPDYVEKLRAFATQQGFADRLSFPGFLAKKELAALFARTNVLVFPSVFEEPFGKTQIEAMAAGLLVISSGTGGSRDIVRDGETGLVFKSGDAGDLAQKLAAVQANPEAAENIASAGHADAFRFSTSASVERLEAIFQELIADAHRSRKGGRPASTKTGEGAATAEARA